MFLLAKTAVTAPPSQHHFEAFSKLPEACRLTDTQFELNAELREQAEDMLKTKVEQIKLQNQWGLAKSELELEKVHGRFRAQDCFQISAK